MTYIIFCVYLQDGAFHLKSEEDDFKKKSASIFGGLGEIESRHKAHVNARKKFSRESEEKYMKPDPETLIPLPRPSDGRNQPPSFPRQPQFEMRQRSPEEAGFKRPQKRAPRAKPRPDYKVNPEKWTMYDLGDVSRQDLTEGANTGAAMDFLRQQREGKYASEISRCKDTEMKEDTRVIFQKPSDKGAETSGSEFRDGSKLHMPEYVVGEKRAKSTKRSHDGQAVGEVVGLGHLARPEDEGESVEGMEVATDDLSGASSSVTQADTTRKLPPLPDTGDTTRNLPPLPDTGADPTAEKTDATEPVAFKKSKSKSRNMRKRTDDDDEWMGEGHASILLIFFFFFNHYYY